MSLNGVFTAQDEMDLFQKTGKNTKALQDESKYVTPVVDDFMVDPKDPVEPDSDDSESEDEDELDRLARMEVDIAVQLDLRKNEDESRNKERRKKKAIKETRRQRATTQWAAEMDGFAQTIDEKAAEEHAKKIREDLDDDDEDQSDAGSKGSDDDEDDESKKGSDAEEGSVTKLEALEEPKSKRRKKGEPEVPKEETWRADKRADRWFSQDLFSGLKDDFDPETDVHKDDDVPELSDDELPQMPLSDKQKAKKKRKKQQERLKAQGIVPEGQKETLEICPAPDITPLDEPAPGSTTNGPKKPEDPHELAETLALGSLMIQKKTRMDLIDSAFNRWTFDKQEGLPSWFNDEENKFNTPELPVSKELMQQFREKLREINARPIRKVAEAQGRKRKRLQHRIDKLRKTAQMLMETPDMSEGAKANQIKKLVAKNKRQEERKVSYVALKKGGGGKKVDKGKAPKGAKVKVVDSRLKSDTRAKKRTFKKMDKHGRSKMSKKTEKRSKKRRGKNK